MTTRLETVAKDLAARLHTASPEQLRTARLAACEMALRAARIHEPFVLESHEELQWNDCLSAGRIEALTQLAAALDDHCLDLQEHAGSDPARLAEAHQCFKQARATTALVLAAGEDPLAATLESLYEAAMALEDSPRFYTELAEHLFY